MWLSNRNKWEKRLYLTARICGRNTFLTYIISFPLFILALTAFMIIGLVVACLVGFFIIVYVIVFGIDWVFNELWKLLYEA
jgi:hypothetical protein